MPGMVMVVVTVTAVMILLMIVSLSVCLTKLRSLVTAVFTVYVLVTKPHAGDAVAVTAQEIVRVGAVSRVDAVALVFVVAGTVVISVTHPVLWDTRL